MQEATEGTTVISGPFGTWGLKRTPQSHLITNLSRITRDQAPWKSMVIEVAVTLDISNRNTVIRLAVGG